MHRGLPPHAVSGIACVVGSMVLLSLQDTVVKWLGATYPLHQIVLTRALITTGLILVALTATGRLGDLRIRRPSLHLARGLLMVLANSMFFCALITMPIAEAVALFFVAPLFITVLSATVLGETVGPRRWVAVVAGFAGVVVMVRPGSGAFTLIALLPVGAAATYAIFQTLTRHIGTTDSLAALSFYVHATFVVAALIMGIAVGDGRFAGSGDPSIEFLLRAWRMPTGEGALLLVLVGFLITTATLLLTQAYRTTEPATIAPFEYVALPLSALWGYLIFQEVPDAIALLGMVLIVGSGVFIILRTERLRSG